MSEKFDKSWKIYTQIMDLIKFSDTKAAAILAINGVIFGLIFRNMFEIIQNFPEKNLLIGSIAIASIITGIISICLSIYCLFPHTNSENHSIFFFGHISQYTDVRKYNKDFLKTVSNDTLINLQLSEQIWEISKIASNKYTRVKWSMRFLGLTIIFLMISLIILFGKLV